MGDFSVKKGKKQLAVLLVASMLAGYLPIDSGIQLVNAEEDIVTTSIDPQESVEAEVTQSSEIEQMYQNPLR